MHSTTRTLTKHITLGTLLIGALAIAGVAEAGDRDDRRSLRRHDARIERSDQARQRVQQARRIDRTLDRRGQLIDAHLDALAFVAVVAGDYRMARELDRAGDRIERRYDRRGDRVLRHVRHDVRHSATRRHVHHAHPSKRGHRAHRHHDGCGHRGHDRRADRGNHLDAFALGLHRGHR